jgi:hypothetical protein
MMSVTEMPGIDDYGVKEAFTCSGISQPTWYFSTTFEPFTGG